MSLSNKMSGLKERKLLFGIGSLGCTFVLILCYCNGFGQTKFTDVTQAAGIQHQFKVMEGMFGGGICVFDFDKDGFEDLYLTSGMNDDILYKNNGNGTFTNVYLGSGLEVASDYVTQGVAGADIDKDGWIDLMVTTITTKGDEKVIPRAKNLLFRNNGNGTFTEVDQSFRIDQMNSFGTAASFGDVNIDGFPDLFIGNYFLEFDGELSEVSDATVMGANSISKDYFLLNHKGKYFKDAYADYGMEHKGFGFGGTFTDYDNDHDIDLIVHNDFGYKRTPNLFYENQYPKKQFIDVSEALEMDLQINAMGAAPGDINEDGFFDYFISDIKFNELMMSQGAGKPFQNRLKEVGMSLFTISWGANFADFDHDGDLDLYVANGDLNPNCQPMADSYFENQGDGTFVNRASFVGLDDYGIGRGSVIFDIENDGDMDILVINQEAVQNYPVPSVTHLYRNDSTLGNWIKVDLIGHQSTTNGIGSRVEIFVGDRKQMREVDGGGASHGSQNSTIVHFGLGDAQMIDSVVVTWVGGMKSVNYEVSPNQLFVVEEVFLTAKPNDLQKYILIAVPIVVLFGIGWLIKKKSA